MNYNTRDSKCEVELCVLVWVRSVSLQAFAGHSDSEDSKPLHTTSSSHIVDGAGYPVNVLAIP
jgi:hypothetical protein